MATTARRTIVLKNYSNIKNEYTAIGVITPGSLIELTSANKVQHNSSAADANPQVMFACRDELQGKTIADDYAITDKVNCWNATTGEEVYARLDNGESVAIGAKLESAGNGTLQAYSSGKAFAVALEAVDMSDSSGGDPSTDRISIRII